MSVKKMSIILIQISETKGQCNYDNEKRIESMADTRHEKHFHRMKDKRIKGPPFTHGENELST